MFFIKHSNFLIIYLDEWQPSQTFQLLFKSKPSFLSWVKRTTQCDFNKRIIERVLALPASTCVQSVLRVKRSMVLILRIFHTKGNTHIGCVLASHTIHAWCVWQALSRARSKAKRIVVLQLYISHNRKTCLTNKSTYKHSHISNDSFFPKQTKTKTQK